MAEGTVQVIVVAVIAAGLIFALSNGLHDASSVVATFIACGAASPGIAVLLASFFGLAGAVFGGSLVANTISSVIDLPASVPLLYVLLAAIIGATLWNAVTWGFGLPSSSTHALIGGIVGAVIVSSGPGHVLWGVRELAAAGHQFVGIVKIVVSLGLSPLLGFVLAFAAEKAAMLLLRNAKAAANKWLKRLQWVVTAGLSFSHGANDTQKILGLIILALAAGGGASASTVPIWARLGSGAFLFLGTLLGGWRIMKTVGRGIYELKPVHSLSAQLSSAMSLLFANATGAPVSTTHVVVGTVMGVGAADNFRMVNWKVVKDIIVSWVITIPAAGAAAAVVYLVMSVLSRAIMR
ncbi:inorganic phosphate transporter [Oscillospiraceae bacterium CM]|nr:inorganic phosphate transporter [Oscillospiraceae bacterium CM]